MNEEEIECDFSRGGHLEVACKQKHFDDYARQVEVIAREFNHQMRVVQRSELASEIGSINLLTAAWSTKSAPG